MKHGEWNWYNSPCGERFGAAFPTREDAIDDLCGEPGYVARACFPVLKLGDFVKDADIQHLLENIDERINEEWSDPEGAPVEIDGDLDLLRAHVVLALNSWQLTDKVEVQSWVFAETSDLEAVN